MNTGNCKWLFIVTALLSIFVFTYGAANAAPATDLKCKACVGGDELGPGAKPAGGDFDEGIKSVVLANSDVVITLLVMTLPGPGVVIVNFGGYAEFAGVNPGRAECSITKDTVVGDPKVAASRQVTSGTHYVPIATTRGFQETSGGMKRYNLICKKLGGSILGSVRLRSVSLTAMFGPRRY